MPLFLLGGIGFAVAFFVAWVLKKLAKRRVP
jgi:flagellar biogenesis protein FliO